jgi:hypothetical protein
VRYKIDGVELRKNDITGTAGKLFEGGCNDGAVPVDWTSW